MLPHFYKPVWRYRESRITEICVTARSVGGPIVSLFQMRNGPRVRKPHARKGCPDRSVLTGGSNAHNCNAVSICRASLRIAPKMRYGTFRKCISLCLESGRSKSVKCIQNLQIKLVSSSTLERCIRIRGPFWHCRLRMAQDSR